jgi:glutamate synthase (NADPH) small chain
MPEKPRPRPNPINPKSVEMPHQAPQARILNFDEVALGYTAEMASAEAARCLVCKTKPCIAGCPVGVEIPGFVEAIRQGELHRAAAIMYSSNAFPAICGRVCPQEVQCQALCTIGKKGEPVQVGRLERYVGDWAREQGWRQTGKAAPSGHRVAVIGAGPAGLACAADFAKLGHDVTVFEALHKPGGVLAYGIPSFRLPRTVIQAEVDAVKELGVRIQFDWVIGKTVTIDELLTEEEFEAVFVGTGAGLPSFLRIPGENLNGVYSANEFLTRVNLMGANRFPATDTPVRVPKRVAVVGGGNVAMDSVRSSLRLGAERAYIVYRRSEAELPARREEYEHAKEEGVDFQLLTNPTRILDDGKGNVAGIECLRMALGEPDSSGRRRPVAVAGSEFVIEVDAVIVAVGTSPNPLLRKTTADLKTGKHGTIVTDEATARTMKPRVWAGGDAVTGAATVILAMGEGRRAAADIDIFLRGEGPREWPSGETEPATAKD